MEKNREIFQRLPFWEKLTEEQESICHTAWKCPALWKRQPDI